MDLQHAYDLANRQRFIALKNSFDIIRQFAEPSLDRDSFAQFERIEQTLLKRYVEDVKSLPEMYGDAFPSDQKHDELITHVKGLT